jgi:hypothetical protein
MRAALLILPLAILATPALAKSPSAPVGPEAIRLPPELTDPRWADRLTDAMMAMSKVFLELPVGEVEAAVEGRPVSSADKRRTVQSETGLDEQQLRAQIDSSRPQMRAAMKALSAALPAMVKGISDAQQELDRATANMPQPGYPKR